jgi:hypothetical protein
VNLTLPVGADPDTVAMKVTAFPAVDGFAELVIPVAVNPKLIVCEYGLLLDPAFAPSPL